MEDNGAELAFAVHAADVAVSLMQDALQLIIDRHSHERSALVSVNMLMELKSLMETQKTLTKGCFELQAEAFDRVEKFVNALPKR